LLKASLNTPSKLWAAKVLKTECKFYRKVIGNNIPRYLQDLYKDVWLRLNTVLPRRLWVLTVRSLVDDLTSMSRIDVADDPLQVNEFQK